LVTAGSDGYIKVWDLRHNYRQLLTYTIKKPAYAIGNNTTKSLVSTFYNTDVSQRGVLAVSQAGRVTVGFFWIFFMVSFDVTR
jgi:hypothetical protein